MMQTSTPHLSGPSQRTLDFIRHFARTYHPEPQHEGLKIIFCSDKLRPLDVC